MVLPAPLLLDLASLFYFYNMICCGKDVFSNKYNFLSNTVRLSNSIGNKTMVGTVSQCRASPLSCPPGHHSLVNI